MSKNFNPNDVHVIEVPSNGLDISAASLLKIREDFALTHNVNIKNVEVKRKRYKSISKITPVNNIQGNDEKLNEDVLKGYYEQYFKDNNLLNEDNEDTVTVDKDFFYELDERINSLIDYDAKSKQNQNRILKSIKIKNIYSFGEVDIDFTDLDGLCLIDGKNASGKSSFRKAISFGYYGSKAVSSLNDVFNIYANDNEGYIIMEFEINKTNFTVIRLLEKKPKSVSQKLYFLRNEPSGNYFFDMNYMELIDVKNHNPSKIGFWCEKTYGDKTLNEDYLLQLIGDFKDYDFAHNFSNQDLLKWLAVKPTERKGKLYDAFGYSIFEQKFKPANQEYLKFCKENGVKENKEDIEQRIDYNTLAIAAIEKNISVNENEKAHTDSLKEATRKKIEEKNREIIHIDSSLSGMNIELLNNNKTTIKNKKTQIESQLNSIIIDKSSSELNSEQLTSELNIVNDKILSLKRKDVDIDYLNRDVKKLLSEYKSIESKLTVVNKKIEEFNNQNIKCEKCATPFTNKSIIDSYTDDKNQYEKRLFEIKTQGKIIRENIVKLTDENTVIKNQLNDYNNSKTELQSKLALMNAYNKSVNEKNNLLLTLKTIEIDLEKTNNQIKLFSNNKSSIEKNNLIKQELSNLENEYQSYDDTYKQYDDLILSDVAKKQTLQDSIDNDYKKLNENYQFYKKEEQYKIYIQCHDKKKGIALQLTKNKIPQMNKTLKELQEVCNLPFFVTVEMSNNSYQNINFVINKSGKKMALKNGSGFEQLISSLFLHLISTQQSDYVKFNSIMFLDEIFASIETANLSLALKIIEDNFLQRFNTIFISTHNENVKEMIDKKLYTNKKNNISTITN